MIQDPESGWQPPAPEPTRTPEPELEAEWTWEDLGLGLASLLPILGVGAVMVAGFRRILPSVFDERGPQLLLFQSILYLGVAGTLYALARLKHGAPMLPALAWRSQFPGWASCVMGAPVLAVAVGGLAYRLEAPSIPDPVSGLIQGPVSLTIVVIYAVVLGPVMEELVFRGFLYGLFKRYAGVWPAILTAALLFSALHGAQYEWSWRILVPLGLAGTAFGYARYRTGSTAGSALLHASYNLTLFVLQAMTGGLLPNA